MIDASAGDAGPVAEPGPGGETGLNASVGGSLVCGRNRPPGAWKLERDRSSRQAGWRTSMARMQLVAAAARGVDVTVILDRHRGRYVWKPHACTLRGVSNWRRARAPILEGRARTPGLVVEVRRPSPACAQRPHAGSHRVPRYCSSIAVSASPQKGTSGESYPHRHKGDPGRAGTVRKELLGEGWRRVRS